MRETGDAGLEWRGCLLYNSIQGVSVNMHQLFELDTALVVETRRTQYYTYSKQLTLLEVDCHSYHMCKIKIYIMQTL